MGGGRVFLLTPQLLFIYLFFRSTALKWFKNNKNQTEIHDNRKRGWHVLFGRFRSDAFICDFRCWWGNSRRTRERKNKNTRNFRWRERERLDESVVWERWRDDKGEEVVVTWEAVRRLALISAWLPLHLSAGSRPACTSHGGLNEFHRWSEIRNSCHYFEK